jgi:hypothetical protein
VAIGLGVGDCEGVGDGVDVADCYVERLEIWSSEGGDGGVRRLRGEASYSAETNLLGTRMSNHHNLFRTRRIEGLS